MAHVCMQMNTCTKWDC